MPRALCPVLLAITATALGAADVRVADVRVGMGVGALPDAMEGTLVEPASLNGQSWLAEYDSTPGLSANINTMYGHLVPVGLLVGLQLRSTTGEMALESLAIGGATETADQVAQRTGDKVPSMSYSQSGAALNLGVGWAVTPSVHVELVGLAGLDWVTWDCLANFGVGSTNLGLTTARGWDYSYGGKAGVYWTEPESSWQFGLEGELITSSGDLDMNYSSGEKVEVDFDHTGFALRGVLGHRF